MKFQSTTFIGLILSIAIVNALPITPRADIDQEAVFGGGNTGPLRRMSLEEEAVFGGGNTGPLRRMSLEEEA
ncbi:hypothetical protein BGX27_000454, partial [Mortierella sp. AM989]